MPFRLALLAALVAAPALAQPVPTRVDAPYPVVASLSPDALQVALGRVACGAEPCVELVDWPAVLRSDALAVTAVATPPGGPRVVVRAWVPGTLTGEKRPDRIVPASAEERAWNGARRWDWSVFGQHAAYVEAAPGRSVEVAAARSPEAVDAALRAVDVAALREAPPATAYVLPRSKRVFWTEAKAAEAAQDERPRFVPLVPPAQLQALLPTIEERVWADVESGFTAYARPRSPQDNAATPAAYALLDIPSLTGGGRSVPEARLWLRSVDPDAAPPEPATYDGYRTRRTTVRGVPALVSEAIAPDGTPLSPLPKGAFPPTLLLLGSGREVSVESADSALAVRLLDALSFGAIRKAPAEPLPFAQVGHRYDRGVGTAFVGAYAAPGQPGVVRAGVVRARSEGGAEAGFEVEFALAPGAYASSPNVVGGCLGANADALEYATAVLAAFVLVTDRPVDPCVGVGAPDYPASPAAELARAGGLVLLQDHGPADQTPLLWLESWPALRHSLLPAWALPLAPASPPARRAVGPYDALAASLTTEGGRVPGAPFAAEALFFEAGDRLLSVVAAAPTPAAARARADAFAAALHLPTAD